MSHIKNIEIKNFKSIRHAKLEDCRRVNVLIGYPNVGKSNILEAMSFLSFLREKEKRIYDLSKLIRFERFADLYNYSNVKEPIEITFNDHYKFSVFYNSESFVNLRVVDKREDEATQFISNRRHITLGKGEWGESAGVDDFSAIYRYTDLKDFDVKPYKFSDLKRFASNYSALELETPFGKNLFEVIINNLEIQKELKDLFEPYGLELLIDRSENIVKVAKRIEEGVINSIPFSLIAETIVRLIFYKTAILSNVNSILLFEEPEAHMFPPYIATFMADVLYGEENNQYFISTHSPFVLNDIMEDVDESEYSIYTVGYKKETGETVIRRLTSDDIHEIYQYGIDLFFNLESYLKDAV